MTTPFLMRFGLTFALLLGLAAPASAQTLRFDFQPAIKPLRSGHGPKRRARGYRLWGRPGGQRLDADRPPVLE